MRRENMIKQRWIILGMVLVTALMFLPTTEAVASMNDYCSTPPFINDVTLPNLLLMVDNSASQYDLANVPSGNNYCYDNTYDDTKSYEGYFAQSTVYTYSLTSGLTPTNTGNFVASAMPASSSCTLVNLPYLCIAGSGSTVTSFYATGKLLNWLSISKFDIQKEVLTGGKYITGTPNVGDKYLQAESRGCDGRRFIKALPSVANLTFAVRGPGALEPDYTNPSTQGGNTRIEIYLAAYNSADCQSAINNWLNGSLGSWDTSAKNCFNLSGTGSAVGREVANFTESMRDCYQIKDNIARGATTEAAIMAQVTPNNLMTQCKNVYYHDCPAGSESDLSLCHAPAMASPILGVESKGNYICSGIKGSTSVVKHVAPPSGSAFAIDGSDDLGFLGRCWDPGTTSFDSTCVNEEILHFCNGALSAEVIDPTSGTSVSSVGNIPAIIADAGARALGDPAATLNARATQKTTPTGLLQQYNGMIIFGAMTFNNDGTASECDVPGTGIACTKTCDNNPALLCSVDSECGSGHCVTAPKTDGGKMIYYATTSGLCSASASTCRNKGDCGPGQYCNFVGDHNTANTLINSIDAIQAASWTPFAESYFEAIGYFAKDHTNTAKSNTAFRLQTADYDDAHNPSQTSCRRNNILIITDGMSTGDLNGDSGTTAGLGAGTSEGFVKMYFPSTYSSGTGTNSFGPDTTDQCPSYAGSRSLPALSYIAKNYNINALDISTKVTTTPLTPNDYISTLVVYSGPTNTNIATQPGLCNPYNLMNQTAINGGQPTGAITASNLSKLKDKIQEAFEKVSSVAASGSAVSVLTTSARGVGSMLQAYFLPSKQTGGNNSVAWLGYTQNIWIDPNDNLREDTTNDAQLKLDSSMYPGGDGDRIMKLYFDEVQDETRAAMFTTDSNGNNGTMGACSGYTTESFNQITPIWEAGNRLAWRDPKDRHIFTTTRAGSGLRGESIDFIDTSLVSYATFSAALNANAADPIAYTPLEVVSYVRGEDMESSDPTRFRDRHMPVTKAALFTAATDTKVWKLGDVINSTPKVVGNIPQNTYLFDYSDLSYYQFISDSSLPSSVQNRTSVALIGANDGMLHAFRVGYLNDGNTRGLDALATGVKAKYQNAYNETGTGKLGQEEWAYIPYNALPYLKYLANPNYCHISFVDLNIKVYDVSVGPDSSGIPQPAAARTADSWKTVLFGGMRFGGACQNGLNPINPPISGPTGTIGSSSFFALDITDPLNPVPLWEFSDPDMGYSTSAPAVIRTGTGAAGVDWRTINGNWYVVFGSGPTMLPRSNPNIDIMREKTGYLYVLNLYTGATVTKIPLDHNGIVGDPLVIDADKDYYTESMYFGTSYCSSWDSGYNCNSASWHGKLARLSIPNETLTASSSLPVTYLFDGNYPFTASPDAAKDESGNLWLYAGSGKFFSGVDETDGSQQVFVGFKDKGTPVSLGSETRNDACPSSCTSTSKLCNVTNCHMIGSIPTTGATVTICAYDKNTGQFATTSVVTKVNSTSTVPQSPIGWAIFLGLQSGPTGTVAERVISRPLAVGGIVDYLSYIPATGICTHGGDSYLTAVDYKTGVPSSQVAIRDKGSTTSTTPGATGVEVNRSVRLGPGAPPTGEAIIIAPPKEGKEALKKKIQVATGVIVETENKPVISTVSKILNWLKK